MSMLKEFRDFAVKGNVIDLAVGIIIGAAFGKIVDSLVNDLVMPAINAVLGGAVDFSNQYVVLSGSVPPEHRWLPRAPPRWCWRGATSLRFC